MTTGVTRSVYDGTTGGSDYGGRRTHIIQLLRDTKVPLSVADVAETAGIHVNTARFHLESLVDAGMATRETERRDTPGRRRVLYSGTLPNQTHERAQGYRLLAEILTATIAKRYPDVGDEMYEVGQEWGRYLTSRPAPFETFDEDEIHKRVVDKLDALWFAPELRREPEPHLLLHNCPFLEPAKRTPEVVCQLHVGMINGSLEELRSSQRVVRLEPQAEPYMCRGWLGPVPREPMTRVPLDLAAMRAARGETDEPDDLAETDEVRAAETAG
ncbi:MAG: helix-turn-helix domain-containing protein [Micrococcales bacterium]|nr:helix-turn-helix domain-containing protein [Micrococcales bacterium]